MALPEWVIPATSNGMVELVRDLGFPIALVIFFVWNSNRRETRLIEAINQLQKFIQETMAGALNRNTDVMARVCNLLDRAER